MRRAGFTDALNTGNPIECLGGGGRLAALRIAITAKPCLAGPPFFTDDPVIVDTGHWEINNFIASTVARGAVAGGLPGIKAQPQRQHENVQLHLMAALTKPSRPPASRRATVRATSSSASNTASFQHARLKLGSRNSALIRFSTCRPEASRSAPAPVQPPPICRSGSKRISASGEAYGGAGYWINPGTDNKNFWFSGGVVQSQLTDTLALGGELYYETASSTAAPGTAGYPLGTKNNLGFNLGGTYDLGQTYHILFSFGRSLDNSTTNLFSSYLALRVTY